MNVTHKGSTPCQFDLLVQNLQQQKEIIIYIYKKINLRWFSG